MKDERKKKEQLISELAELRHRIAELEASQAELKRGEETRVKAVSAVVEAMGDALMLHTVDGEVTFVNPAFERIVGRDKSELVGKPVADVGAKLTKPEDAGTTAAAIETALKGEVPTPAPITLVSKEGVETPTLFSVSFMRDAKGQPSTAVVVFKDISELKRAEEALKEKEEHFRNLMEQSPIAIQIMTPEGGIYRVNEAYENLWGITLEDLSDYNILQDKQAREIGMMPYIEKAFAGEVSLLPEFEYDAKKTVKKGRKPWIRSHIYPVKDESGKILNVVMMHEDITERKQAQERIEHLNLVLRAIRSVNQLITTEKDRESLLKGVCDRLIQTRGYHNAWVALIDEAGRLVTAAEAGLGGDFLPMLEKLKRGELTTCGQKALSQSGVVVTDDRASTCADCPLSAKYGGRGAMTVRLEHEGKVYGLLSVSIPRPLIAEEEEGGLFQEVARDIAFALHGIEMEEEGKRAEHALRERVKELSCLYGISSLVERSLLSVAEIFQGTVNIIPSAWQYPEITCARIILESQEVRTENFTETIWNQASDITVRGEWMGSLQVCYLEERPASDEGPFLKEERGLLNAIAEQLGRIIDLKRAETALKAYSERLEEMVEERTKELKDAREQLVRKEKLAILGQLAGGVGHELRNPLAVISNAVYFLQMTVPEAEETTREYLELIGSEVGNADKIVSDLLDFSRTRLVEREQAAVSHLVAEVLEKRPAPENVEVTTELPSDLPSVFVDDRQIGQVLLNLVTNAYPAMPEGGELTISAKAEKGQVCLSIADTGCGISRENMKRLFEPLFTTRARGIGLGLAVSRNLVEANGGSTKVESEEGKGSTFTVVLPTKEVAS